MEINILKFIFFYCLIIISTVGYGYFFLKISTKDNKEFSIGVIGIIGIFFLILYSILSHFFYKHGEIHNSLIVFFGVYNFIKYLKKEANGNDLKIFSATFIIMFFGIIILKNHDDFSYYHFQYTYYITQHPLLIGIGKFNHGLRTPSSIFYLNSLFYFPIVKYYMFNMGALMIMGFSNIIIIKKIKNYLDLNKYDYLLILNLLMFSFINIFFYRLAEHGTDRSAMILVLLFILELLYFINLKGNYKNFYMNVFIILGIIISLKSFYLMYLLFALPIFFYISKYKKIDEFLDLIKLKNVFFNYFCLLIVSLFAINFFNSGCLVYPIYFTCFEGFSWSIPVKQVIAMNDWYEQWSKAGAGPNFRIDNPEIYIDKFNWVSHWIDEYFFNKVSDFIGGLVIMYLIYFSLFIRKRKKKLLNNKNFYLIYLTIIVLCSEWFYNHPSLRYGGYVLIFLLISIPISTFLEKYLIDQKKIRFNVFVLIFITISLFVLRNTERIVSENKQYSPKISIYKLNYNIDKSYFNIEKKFNNQISYYKKCNNINDVCDEFTKKKFNKYIFIKKLPN
tara:strand:- start:85 stop:1767 length:1683 start_codon:yes stop_codon:yes gene_type:complete